MLPVRLPSVLASLAVGLLVHSSLAAVLVPEGDVAATPPQQGAPSSDCPSCSVAQLRRNSSAGGQSDMVEAVKRHILNMLHLSSRPNLTAPVPRAALLNAIRKLQVGRVGRDGSVEIQEEGRDPGPPPALDPPSEVITFAEAGDSPDTVTFDLSKEGRGGAVVERADVWIFLKLWAGPRAKGKALLRLHRAPGQGAPLAEKMVDARRSGWHALDVSRGVQALLDGGGGGGGRLGLAVSCPLCAQAGAAPLLAPERSHRPFLMVALRGGEEAAARRRLRRGLECDGKIHVCCKREFYVNFKDIGWSDWIIAPSGYHANYCEGECPAHMASAGNSALSFHSTVIGHYRLRGYGPFQNLRSCCVPTRLRAMSMLYYNEEQKIIKKDVHNMIVDECGCS